MLKRVQGEIGLAGSQTVCLVFRRHRTGLEIHAAEVIGRAGRLGRTHDHTLLIDPHRLRHVHEIVEVAQPVVGVD